MRVLGLMACTGLLASFHTIIFAYGRQIYSLSRAGYFPQFLSVTHGTRRTPLRALLAGSALSIAAAGVIQWSGSKSPVGAVLLNMAVFGAVVAYVFQMLSFVALRRKFPELARPYRSPVGKPGAVIGAVLSLITLAALFLNPDSRPGVTGAAIWFVFGALYFAFFSRKRLVLSPEEEFAMGRDPVPR
jgi:ethanolamine permease